MPPVDDLIDAVEEKHAGQNFRELPTELSTAHLLEIFDISPQSAINWRRKLSLPWIKVPQHGGRFACRYDVNEILQWAKDNSRKVHLQKIPEDLQHTVNDDLWNYFCHANDGLNFTPTVTAGHGDSGAADTEAA